MSEGVVEKKKEGERKCGADVDERRKKKRKQEKNQRKQKPKSKMTNFFLRVF